MGCKLGGPVIKACLEQLRVEEALRTVSRSVTPTAEVSAEAATDVV